MPPPHNLWTAALVALCTTLPLLIQAQDLQTPIHYPPQPVKIPLLGFGTWNLKVSPENTTAAVAHALQTGYRHIDAAAAYGNEVAVGKGIAEGLEKAEIKRKDLWVTSKLWNDQYVSDSSSRFALFTD